MSTMHLDIVSAEEEIFSGTVKNLSAAAMMGEVGIFPKHTPMITPLKPGEIKVITEDDEEKVFFISGGVLEVQPDIVTVLADTAIRGEDLDEAKAAEAKKRAEEALADKSDNIDAVFSVVIPPRGGHGSDPVSELGGFFVMMNTYFN